VVIALFIVERAIDSPFSLNQAGIFLAPPGFAPPGKIGVSHICAVTTASPPLKITLKSARRETFFSGQLGEAVGPLFFREFF